MPGDNLPIADLAQHVLDGDVVDWAALEPGSQSNPLIGHLKVVAAVAEAHRGSSGGGLESPPTQRIPGPLDSWGHLRISESIGHGAFGTVYRAWDTRLDREVALKLIPTGTDSLGVAPSVIAEGRLLARVRHPNVVTIHGADQIDDCVGLWMEFIPGRTLEELLRGGTVFEAVEVSRIGIELCRALAAVHAAGLLHRDIKAQNVMRADDGRIVLMDFGTGRELADDASDLAGTPLCLAPELFKGRPATAQSDIYGLGVLLYHLLTTSYPVEGRTIREVRASHESKPRADLRVQRPDVPPGLARVIDRAIDPQPERRYSTATSFGAALEATNRSSRFFRPVYAAAAAALVIAAAWFAFVQGPRPMIFVSDIASSAEDQEVAAGLTYETIRLLQAIEGLTVRSGALAVEGGIPNEKVVQAATTGPPGPAFVLVSSLSHPSGKWAIDARLVSTADGKTHWRLTPQSDADLRLLQGRIAAGIAKYFGLQASAGRYQTDPVLYELFLSARALHSMHRVRNTERAAAIFEAVYTKDPTFTPALAAWVSASSWRFRGGGTRMPSLDPRIEESARKAVALDPFLAEAQAGMGWLYAQKRDWKNATTSFRRALELDPNLTTTHSDYYLSTLQATGDLEEALQVMNAAYAVAPMSLHVRLNLGSAQIDSGQYADALANLEWVRKRDPDYTYVNELLGRALMLNGQWAEALPYLEKDSDSSWGYIGYLYAVSGRTDDARALVAAHPGEPARQMLIYAGLGDLDKAIESLEKVEKVHPLRAAAWYTKPEMKNVRDSGDPRLGALRRRLGFPQ